MKANGINTADVRARRGRPSLGERVSLGLRVTSEHKKRLDAAAKRSGRSQSQEAEMRIEQSFWLEDLIEARLITLRTPATGKGD
jgi:hypothetical protein